MQIIAKMELKQVYLSDYQNHFKNNPKIDL
jgi:hypothetical protein